MRNLFLMDTRKVKFHMTEEQNQETHDDDTQDENESGGIGQWFQDNLRIIVSIIIVALLAGGIYSYSKRTEAPQVASNDTQETEVAIEEKEISDEEVADSEDTTSETTVVIGTAPDATDDNSGLDELVEDEKDEQGTVTQDAASTDNTDEAVEEAPTEETTEEAPQEPQDVTPEEESTEDVSDEEMTEEDSQTEEITEEETEETDATEGSDLLAKIKAGAISVKDKIAAEEKKIEEELASAEDETTDTVDEGSTPTEEVPADTSIETSESFVETATTGDGVTNLARRALANSLEKNPDTTLTGAHKVYIEDYMQKNVAHSGTLYVGDTVEFSKTLINEAIASAHTLSDAQLQNLQPYATAAGY